MKNLLILLFMPIVLLAQNQQELKAEITKSFNRERMAKTAQLITEDSTLSKSVKKLYKQGAFNKEMDKDEIRKMLREQKIYDYNIELVKIPVKKTKSNEIKLLENKKIKSILQDTNYNSYGMVLNEDNDTIRLLFIERYFNLSYGIITGPEGTKYCTTDLVILLETKSDTAIYYEQIQDEKQINNKRNGKMIYHERVDIQVHNFNKEQYNLHIEKNTGDIVFYNKTGKILAYIENH